ncbi:hypothetical protein ACFPMF_01855 [Larkinella bovis]|uniref:Uncharacterized protein n=1 Tax=Larkinella bovis TaxID=683041 RepID=A0ABW0I3E4_9BACT
MKKQNQYPANILDKVAEIYSLCLQIDALGKFATSYNYDGSVKSIHVRVMLFKGVSDESDAVTVYDSYNDSANTLYLDWPDRAARLSRCIARLKELRNLSIPEAQINLTYDY